MKRNSVLFKLAASMSLSALLLTALPVWAFAPTLAPHQSEPRVPSRSLSAEELNSMSGKLGENPYMSGSQRYSINMMGIDLLTMNFSTSATDLSFEGGFGIPVAMTRTYSANEADEGPFGKGWILSVDIRTTAGGLLKSSSAPDRSVPVHVKQFPIDQKNSDGSLANAERIATTDASGRETNYQLDVDGVYSGPLWDKNVYDCEYEESTSGDHVYSTLKKMKVLTPEGTLYEYEKHGAYDGTNQMQPIPYAGTPSTPKVTPSNVLKITKITDRHGNETTFSYTSAVNDRARFNRANGTVWENRLTQVAMPGGRSLAFTWTKLSSSDNFSWRITEVEDGSNSSRAVSYSYTSGIYLLETVTSPEGKVTTYGYDGAYAGDNFTSTYGSTWIAGALLTSITDCRQLTTNIAYAMSDHYIPGTDVRLPVASAFRVTQPNGVRLYVGNKIFMDRNASGLSTYLQDYPTSFIDVENFDSQFMVGPNDSSADALASGQVLLDIDTTNPADPLMVVKMKNRLSSATQGQDLFPSWVKTYRANTGDLINETSYVYDTHPTDFHALHGFSLANFADVTSVDATTTYNFQGNPLEKTIVEKTGSTTTSTKTVSYAYHGYDKYFQQKAVKDPAGRISYTDYYDRTASDGKKGQVYRVFDPKWSNGYTNSSGTGWKNNIVPSNSDLWSAQFDYDTDGRPTTVEKLQKGTVGSSGTYERVKTVTEYGGSGTPFWGAASKVTEDHGSGKINRVTETITYDSAGRATVTKDAPGKRFHTVYDLDGRVETVEVDPAGGTSYDPILEYTYGSSGITNGMPTSVEDLTDSDRTISQSMTYHTSGGGKGQVASVNEQWIAGGNTVSEYLVSYQYTSRGERDTVVYETPNGTRGWRYGQYQRVGSPESAGRAFTELIEGSYVSNQWVDGDDHIFYHFDTGGRLLAAAFAQTENDVWASWPGGVPPDPYSFIAKYRALQENQYDAAGRVLSVANHWQSGVSAGTGGVPVYSTVAAIPDGKVAYAYDSTTGLRTAQGFYTNSGSNWASSAYRVEDYTYDSSLDYLTGVDYNDGLSHEVRTWAYDAAGNRSSDSALSGSWTYDNLNRMTASPGHTYSNDILGNRTHRDWSYTGASPSRYDWDVLGRALLIAGPTTGSTYSYRADGQRIEKVEGVNLVWTGSRSSGHYDANYASNRPTSRYFYDGQMGFEDDYNPSGTVTTVMRYGLGARGIDRMEYWDGTTTTFGYPLYDGHGSMRGVLSRSGTSYSTSNWRTYDVWGSVRSGSTTADPKQRYVANLGHVADDESGLTYMRARYYEPSTGRFISEDQARDGWNWFVYASNDPILNVDPSGKASVSDWLGAYLFLDLISVLGLAVTVIGYNAAYAELGFTGATVWWAGGIAFFLVLGIYSAASTFKSLVELIGGLSYRAGSSGRGAAVLAILDQLKSVSLMAPLAHLFEIYTWLGMLEETN